MKNSWYYWFLVVFFVALLPRVSLASTYTVNAPTDDNDGTCTMPFTSAANDCTLREAIAIANAHAGADTINFSIDSSFQSDATYFNNNQYTLTVGSVLSTLNQPTTISAATSWDGSNNRPGIRLYSTTTSFNGLTFGSGAVASSVSGLEIQGFRNGIGNAATSLTIGTNCDGTLDSEERNVIHGAANNGINTTAASGIIAGNYIGLDDNGTTYDPVASHSINIAGAAADNITIGYRATASSCSAAQQRNSIAGGASTTSSSAINISGTGTDNLNGDATLAPNDTMVAGNYLGVDATGTVAAAGLYGVQMQNNTISSIIGTNGDGVNDSLEGNIIFASDTGVHIFNTGNNRVSGNLIGVTPTGQSNITGAMYYGINARGIKNIIGWCDTTINTTLCSDSGGSEQGNVLGGATADGIRLGFGCDDCRVYGNWIGTDTTATIDLGNSANGIFLHRANTGMRIGGDDNKANIIQYNAIGIRADGEFIGAASRGSYQTAITDTSIDANTIQANDTSGILLYWTDNYDATPSGNITIQNATITANGTIGIEVTGASPIITGNTIMGNVGSGILVQPAFIAYDSNIEAIPSYNPADVATNLVAQPTITSNTFDHNGESNIDLLDCSPSNVATLFSDNTFQVSDTATAIRQRWYGTAQVFTASSATLSTEAQTGTTVTLTPATGTASSAVVSAIDVNDASTWFTLMAYTISGSGTTTTANPYSITASGTYTSQTPGEYTFDGGSGRFQIGQVLASTTPATPTTESPATGATDQSLTPTLASSDYVDSDDTQASTTWQLYTSSSACSSAAVSDAIFNVTSTTSLTSYTVPSDTLLGDTTYYWRVAYTNTFGNSSQFSDCAVFTTSSTAPSLASALPDQTTTEDSTTPLTLQLSDYFTDPDGQTLTYSATVADDNIVEEVSDATLTITSAHDWFGSTTLTVTACDTDDQCTSSTLTVQVTPVNDAPLAPQRGFSPTDGETIGTVTPTISWLEASDVDDAGSVLTYQIRLGTHTDPQDHYTESGTSAAGEAAVTLATALMDEQTYYYTVRTIDAAGAKSDWSAVQSFSTNTAFVPSLTLTKTISLTQPSATDFWNVSTAALALGTFNPAMAAATATSTIDQQLAQQSLLATLLSCVMFAIAFIALLHLSRHPRHLWVAISHQAALAFDRIHQPAKAPPTISYTLFKRRLLIARWLVRLAIIIFVPALTVNVLHAQISNWVAQQNSSAQVIQPGETFKVMVTYSNIGDGAASQAVLTDSVPDTVTIVSTDALAAQTGQQLTYQLHTLPVGATATISYTLRALEPLTGTEIILPAARLTAAELVIPVTSNSPTLNVISSSISGMVRGAGGQVLADTTIKLQRGIFSLTTQTNSIGYYEFTGISSGDYTITVIAPAGYQSASAQAVQLDSGTDAIIDWDLQSTDDESNETDNNNNANTNTNSNINNNTTTDTNTNNSTTPTTPPTDTITETDTPEQTTLLEQFQVERVNDIPISGPITIYLGDNPKDADPGAVVLGSNTDQLVFSGKALPYSKITIQICYTIITTTSDETGAWIMVVPRNLLQTGENVVSATVTRADLSTDTIVIARVQVDDQVTSWPRYYWLGVIALLIVYSLNALFWLLGRSETSTSPWPGYVLFIHTVVLISTIIVLSLPLPHDYSVVVQPRPDTNAITANAVNDQILSDQPITLSNVAGVDLTGTGPNNQQLAFSICPNQPFRYLTTTPEGRWSLFLPMHVLPHSNFTLTAQAVDDQGLLDEAAGLVNIVVNYEYLYTNWWRALLMSLIATAAIMTILNYWLWRKQR